MRADMDGLIPVVLKALNDEALPAPSPKGCLFMTPQHPKATIKGPFVFTGNEGGSTGMHRIKSLNQL
jgi:hypothetical protein